MKANMGSTDRLIRIIIAVIIAVLFSAKLITGIPGVVLLVFAGILLLTSLISFCLLYLPFGINTCKKSK